MTFHWNPQQRLFVIQLLSAHLNDYKNQRIFIQFADLINGLTWHSPEGLNNQLPKMHRLLGHGDDKGNKQLFNEAMKNLQ